MSISRRDFFITAAALASIAPCEAEAAAQPSSRTISNRVDDYLTRLSGFGYSGATLLVRDGNVLLRKGYGLANDAAHIPVAPDTIFDVGSHAKTFTAGVMMRLVARGRVQLCDPITKFLSGVPEDKRTITIEQLLSHTAGLDSDFPFVNETSEYYEEVSRDEAVTRILATTLIDTPGNNFSYSNTGYVLAAAIVEAAAERPFRDVLRAEIFSPLGMTSTGFWGSGLPDVPDARLARSYDDTTETGNLRERSSTTWMDLGGGEVVSTLDDLYVWMQAMRGSEFLPAALRDRMWTPVKSNEGLGWSIEPAGPGGRRIHHGGDYVGFGCELAYYPDHDMVLVNLANRRNQVLGTRYAADRVIPLIVLGQPLRMWPSHAFDTFDIPPLWSPEAGARLSAALGVYRLHSGAEVMVTNRNDGFRISARGQEAIDAILPATAEERALRARCNERATALVRAAVAGDNTVLTDTLRHGAPIDSYRQGLVMGATGAERGNLVSIEPVGTAPSGLPVGGHETSLKLNFERGDKHLRFGWDPAQDRIINMGLEGAHSLGSTPLRASPDGQIVGWDIITARSIRLKLRENRLEIESSDGARAIAVRTT